MSPPELQLRKTKTHTHTYTQRVKGNVIPLAALFLYHVAWQRPGPGLHKKEVYRRCGCKQQRNSPWSVMCILHLLGIFSSWWSASTTEIFQASFWAERNGDKPSPAMPSSICCKLTWCELGPRCTPLLFVPALFPDTRPCQRSLCTSYFTCSSSATFRRAVL